MSQSVVSIAINVRNLTGAAFNQLRSQVGATQNAFRQLTRNSDTAKAALGDFFSKGNSGFSAASAGVLGLNSNLLTLVGTLGIVSAAYQRITASANNAIDTQVKRVSALSTAKELLGLTESQALKFTQSNENAISKLGLNLPVETREVQTLYDAIFDNFVGAFKPRGASPQQIALFGQSAASRLAIAANLSETNIGNASANVQSYLAGAGLGELRGMTLFGKNPRLLNEIEKLLKSGVGREEALIKALETSVTDEAAKRLQGTAKAQISSISDFLFDPANGLFSFARDLDKADGYQTVVDSGTKTLNLLFGGKGLFEQIGRLLGFSNSDPIKPLYDGINAFNAYLEGVNKGLTQLKSLTGAQIGTGVGKFLADATNLVFDGLLGAVASINYKGLIKGVLAGIGSFFANLNWKVYLAGAVSLLVASVVPTVIGAVGVFIAGAISAIAGALIGVPVLLIGAITLGVIAIAKLISDNWEFLSNFVSTNWNKLTKKVGEIIDGVAKTVFDFFGIIQEKIAGITQALSTPNPTITAGNTSIETPSSYSSIKSIGGGLLNFIGGFFSRADGYIPASNGLFGALASEAARKPANTDFVIANSSEAVLTPRMLTNLTGNLLSAGSKTVNFQPGAITFNLPSGTPQEIALAAIEIIENALSQELETRIA